MKNLWYNFKGILLLLAIFIFIFAIDVAAVMLYFKHVNDFLNEQPKNFRADVGVIFFGDYLEHDRYIELGPDSRNRADEAIRLYRHGRIKNIICVGGYEIRTWRGKPHLLCNYLIANGIPKENLTYDSLSFNTITNWREAKKIIALKNFKTTVAISSPLHIYRIASMIDSEQVLFAAYPYVPEGFGEFRFLYQNIHREWLSLFLNFALKDEVRNTMVYLYRSVDKALSDFFCIH
jgi:uncharacterized SAM-binding protein YcdF (DUF218 family)